ncbi:hypothetical protein Y043_5069 [Burkholderia pseudomallei MSHR2138]|nr:hypothetical protein Y043_5069 [Burkholderia pseudomallei MSHR2138]
MCIRRCVQPGRLRYVAVFQSGRCSAASVGRANDYGTVRCLLMVMKSCTLLGEIQRIAGVLPRACLLLHAEGESVMRAALAQIDAVEALADAGQPAARGLPLNRCWTCVSAQNRRLALSELTVQATVIEH